jgi:hypothetical protein
MDPWIGMLWIGSGVSHPVLRQKPDAHCMYAQDQVCMYTTRITTIQVNQCHYQSTLLQEYCLITSRLITNSLDNAQHTIGS